MLLIKERKKSIDLSHYTKLIIRNGYKLYFQDYCLIHGPKW